MDRDMAMVRARVLLDEHDKERGAIGTEGVYEGMTITTDHRLNIGCVKRN